MACTEPGCAQTKIHARGLCDRHYTEWRRSIDRGECSVDGCTDQVDSRGLCNRHYHKWRKYGDPLVSLIGGPADFIRRALEHDSDECLLWPFHVSRGYGRLRWNGRMVAAHRLVAELAYGPPPSHTHRAAHAPVVCHEPTCVNPRHLRWATEVDNHRDMDIDQTSPAGERNGNAKLTEAQVQLIRQDARPARVVAAEYGVSSTLIGNIRSGIGWKHLPWPSREAVAS